MSKVKFAQKLTQVVSKKLEASGILQKAKTLILGAGSKSVEGVQTKPIDSMVGETAELLKSKAVKQAGLDAVKYVETTATRLAGNISKTIRTAMTDGASPDKQVAVATYLQSFGAKVEVGGLRKAQAEAAAFVKAGIKYDGQMSAKDIIKRNPQIQKTVDELMATVKPGQKFSSALKFSEEQTAEFGKFLYQGQESFRDMAKTAYAKKIIEPELNKLVHEMITKGGEKTFTSAMAKATGRKPEAITEALRNGTIDDMFSKLPYNSSRNFMRDLTKEVVKVRAVESKNMIDAGLTLNTVEKFFLPLDEKLEAIGAVAAKSGNREMVDAVGRMHKHITHLPGIQADVGILKTRTMAEFKAYTPEKQAAIKAYIEAAKKPALVEKTMGTFKRSIEMDEAVARKLGLSETEILSANRISNSLRMVRKLDYDLARNKFDPKDFRQYVDNIDKFDTKMLYRNDNFSYGGMGDIKEYFPRRISKEHFETVASTKSINDPMHKYMQKGSPLNMRDYGFRMSRSADSKLGQDDSLAVSPVEAVEWYFNAYGKDLKYQQVRQAMEGVKQAASTLDPTGVTRLHQDKFRNLKFQDVIKDLDRHVETILTPTKNPDNIITQTVATLADASTAAVLGLNEKMFVFNSGQFIMNSQFRSASSTMQSITKTPSLMAKMGLTAVQQKSLKAFWQDVGSGSLVEKSRKKLVEDINDPLLQKVMNDYFRKEMPDALQSSLIPIKNDAVRSLFNAATTMFQASDVISRTHGLTAATIFSKSKYDALNYNNSLIKGDPTATNKLAQALHLDRFGMYSRAYVMEASRNPAEFISRYSEKAVRQEMYNYNKLFAPESLAMASKHWATARAMRFMSWPMHYTSYLRGVQRAFESGDKAPLKSLAITAGLWYTAMSLGSSTGGDMVSEWALYGRNRTPFLGTVNSLVSTPFSQRGGMLVPALGQIGATGILGMEKFEEMIGNTPERSWTSREIMRAGKNAPTTRKAKYLYDTAIKPFLEE